MYNIKETIEDIEKDIKFNRLKEFQLIQTKILLAELKMKYNKYLKDMTK